MTDTTNTPTVARDWRMVMLIGCGFFPAALAFFYFAVPFDDSLKPVPEWLASALLAALATVIAMLPASIAISHRLRLHNRRIRVALDNMVQGLCMFDANERLVVCNRRYQELYQLPPDLAKPGRSLASLLEFRIANGSFARDPDEYRRELLASMREGATRSNEIKSADGRIISVTNEPMADGGWVATHEDITERRNAEHERASLQAQRQRRSLVEQAIAAFRRRVEDLLHTVADGAKAMRSTATTLLANSGQTSKGAESAVGASNEASANVHTAAIATDELSGSIGEIARQLTLTTDIVRAAVGEAQGTNRQIAALTQAAQKIGDVVMLIRAIAGQTNLLALNATIEAARAGVAGKGFAVVAAEVKSLAVQTAKATEDISKLIGAVQNSTGGAVDAIGRISGRMREIESYAAAVSAAVEEQSAATAEISQNVASAAEGAKLVVKGLDEVAGAASETRESAESVLAASQAVESAATHLRREVEDFLARVAA